MRANLVYPPLKLERPSAITGYRIANSDGRGNAESMYISENSGISYATESPISNKCAPPKNSRQCNWLDVVHFDDVSQPNAPSRGEIPLNEAVSRSVQIRSSTV